MSVGTLSWQRSPPGSWSRDEAAAARQGGGGRALFPGSRRWEGKQRQGGCPGTPPEPGTPRDLRRGTPGWATTRWQPEPGDEAAPARPGPSSVSRRGQQGGGAGAVTVTPKDLLKKDIYINKPKPTKTKQKKTHEKQNKSRES